MLKALLPLYRFIQTDETIIHRNHHSPLPLTAGTIRVLNWNIAKNNHDREWRSDFSAILKRYRPDLIFLQEVSLCAQARHVAELAGMGWCFAPNFKDTYHNQFAGVLTASPAMSLKRKAFITADFEPVTKTPKVSLVTEYALPETSKTLLTVNSHLINFVDLPKFEAQLQKLEKTIASHSGAVIFSGDFNTWNQPRWQLLTHMTRRLGLAHAKFPPSEAQNLKRFLLSPPLDHIFYRGVQQNFIHAKVLNQVTSSDHKPMIVEFSIDV